MKTELKQRHIAAKMEMIRLLQTDKEQAIEGAKQYGQLIDMDIGRIQQEIDGLQIEIDGEESEDVDDGHKCAYDRMGYCQTCGANRVMAHDGSAKT